MVEFFYLSIPEFSRMCLNFPVPQDVLSLSSHQLLLMLVHRAQFLYHFRGSTQLKTEVVENRSIQTSILSGMQQLLFLAIVTGVKCFTLIYWVSFFVCIFGKSYDYLGM
jgi:hypothetical protein